MISMTQNPESSHVGTCRPVSSYSVVRDTVGADVPTKPTFLNLFSEYCMYQSDVDVEFRILGALQTLSYCLDTDSTCNLAKCPKTNLFVGFIAPSGYARKSFILGVQKEIVGIDEPLPLATEQSLTKYMSNRGLRRGLADLDELDRLLSNMKKGSFMSESASFWNRIWDNERLINVVSASGKERTYETPGTDTYVNIIAATTPDVFRESVPQKVLTGGMFNRFIWAVIENTGEEEPLKVDSEDLKSQLFYLQRFCSYVASFKYYFKIDIEAYNRIFKEVVAFKKAQGEEFQSLVARLDHQWIKVARLLALDLMIHAEVFKHYKEPNPENKSIHEIVVSKAVLEVSWQMAKRWSQESLALMPDDWESPRDASAVVRAIVRFYERSQDVTTRNILRSMRGLRKSRLVEILESLSEAALIKYDRIGNKIEIVDIDGLKGKRNTPNDTIGADRPTEPTESKK